MSSSTCNDNQKLPSNISSRSYILQVGVSAGRLCGVANSHLLDVSKAANDHMALILAMTDLLIDLWRTSQSLQLNLVVAIHKKLALNKKKYPVEHCKGKAGKYTQYSHLTGVTKTNQVSLTQNNTDDSNSKAEQALPFSALIQALPEVAQEIQQFALERDWSQYHTPRNLILALLGEVGELAELVQWKGDDDNGVVEAEELEKFSQELADVTIYLLRLATVVDVVGPLCEQMLQLQGK